MIDLKRPCFVFIDARVIPGYLRDDVTLQCGDSLGWMDQTECYRGRWIKYLSNSQQRIVSQHDTWTPGVAMPLKLSQLKESHEGVYSCEIWKGWHCVHKSNITLKLKGKIWFYPHTFLLTIMKKKQKKPTTHLSPVFGLDLCQNANFKECWMSRAAHPLRWSARWINRSAHPVTFPGFCWTLEHLDLSRLKGPNLTVYHSTSTRWMTGTGGGTDVNITLEGLRDALNLIYKPKVSFSNSSLY